MWGRRGASGRIRPTGDDAEGPRAVLVAAVEQQLEAEADAQERPVGRQPLEDRVQQSTASKAVHRRCGGPDAGHDERVGP